MGPRFAQLFSYVIHPGVVPTLCTAFVLWSTPMYVSREIFVYTVAFVLVATYLLPAIFSALLVRLGTIESLHMREARDRRYPFLISIAFFLLTANALREWPVPAELPLLMMASASVLVILYFALRWTKFSAHLAALGGLVVLTVHMAWRYEIQLLGWIAVAVLLSGFMATARLRLGAHTPFQVSVGFFVGALSTAAFLYWA